MLFLRFLTISIFTSTFVLAQIKPEVNYTGEFANNISGGLRQGSAYLGLLNFKFSLTRENTGLWKGSEIFLNAANSHGGTPTQTFIGDYQGISNIEAGTHSYIQELWLKQSVDDFSITLGVQDMNASFLVSENGSSFINSSFGVPSAISHFSPVPIFPLTTLGATFELQVNPQWKVLTAIYDGNIQDFESNPHNLNWKISRDDGVLSVSEVQFQHPETSELSGVYKAGFIYHSRLRDHDENQELVTLFNKRYAFYCNTDNEISRIKSSTINLFTQFSSSHGAGIENNLYVGCGVLCKKLFADNDELGIAYAGSYFHNSEISEKAIEVTYKRYITENIFIQPDIQYISNPAGEFSSTNSALAGIFRFGFNY